jgi:hypothetical protein
MGIPEYEAKRYEGRVKDGGILVSVHCDSSEEVSRAKEVLKATGAEDVASSGEKAVTTHGVDSGPTDGDRLSSEPRLSTQLYNHELDREATVDPLKVR